MCLTNSVFHRLLEYILRISRISGHRVKGNLIFFRRIPEVFRHRELARRLVERERDPEWDGRKYHLVL